MSPTYNDTITLIETIIDAYGTESVSEEAQVSAIVEQNTSWRHGSNQTAINADLVVFVDPTNSFVQDKANRLEGMLAIVNPFGADQAGAWYRITNVTVSRDTQLSNQIDNVQLALKKTTAIDGIS